MNTSIANVTAFLSKVMCSLFMMFSDTNIVVAPVFRSTDTGLSFTEPFANFNPFSKSISLFFCIYSNRNLNSLTSKIFFSWRIKQTASLSCSLSTAYLFMTLILCGHFSIKCSVLSQMKNVLLSEF